MSPAFLSGEVVELRQLTEESVSDEYVSWLADAEVTRHLESGRFPASKQEIIEFVRSHTGSDQHIFLGIYLKEGGEHVGNIKLGPISWLHRNAELGIMIGAAAARGKGVGTEAIRLLLGHAFDRLNLIRVALGVVQSNAGAIRCYEKVGFQTEGVFRSAVLTDGEPQDIVRMSILAEEFRAAGQ